MKTVGNKNQVDEPVTDDVLQRAIERGQQQRVHELQACNVEFDAGQHALMIGFSDQSAIVLPIKNYPELTDLSHAELARLSLGYAGSALCLDEQDLHVSIAGLVSASAPLMAMAAMVVAARNGSRRSEIKSIAARQNGQKGGRPRKIPAAG